MSARAALARQVGSALARQVGSALARVGAIRAGEVLLR
jgi:hypothetical protein